MFKSKTRIITAAVAVLAVGASTLGFATANADSGKFNENICIKAKNVVHGQLGTSGNCDFKGEVQPPVNEEVTTNQRGSMTVLGAPRGVPLTLMLVTGSGEVAWEEAREAFGGYDNFNFIIQSLPHKPNFDIADLQAAGQDAHVILTVDGRAYEVDFKANQFRPDIYANGFGQLEMGTWRLENDTMKWKL